MTLATYTVHNRIRRELATVLESLVNDSGEILVFQGHTIAIGAPLFRHVSTGRLHKSEIKPDNYPLAYLQTAGTVLTGHNNRPLSQTRGIRCFILMQKATNNLTDNATIEDTLDYYRARVLREFRSNNRDWGNVRISLTATGADDAETSEWLNREFQHPIYSTVVDATFLLPSGNL